MLKLETHDGAAARPCDTCFSAASSVFCRADLAYLCTTCDARIHAAAPLHDRVLVCNSCERAPAAFLCKADSASLCAACDAEIHSANPLARRHHRVPIQPIYGPNSGGFVTENGFLNHDDEAAAWLLVKNGDEEQSMGGAALYGGEVEEYLDLDEYNSCQFNEGSYNHQQQHYGGPHGGDSVVPIQGKNEQHCFQLGYGYPAAASISQTVSISSMEVGVVPESTSEVSMSHTRPPKGTIDLFSSPPIQVPAQLSPMDREARVMRYREKKKSRKFEKTIRYASRKAYAETRPRVKGRFAKRRDAEAEVEVDQMFSSHVSLMADVVYGVVPSF